MMTDSIMTTNFINRLKLYATINVSASNTMINATRNNPTRRNKKRQLIGSSSSRHSSTSSSHKNVRHQQVEPRRLQSWC